MKFAIIRFPGSNCDLDLYAAITDILQHDAAYVDHTEESLEGFDAVLIPGGFSYGDYLRCGVIARFSKIMTEVIRFANEGKLVFGTCNGFQILTEAGLLPGALRKNTSLKFICKPQALIVNNSHTPFTSRYEENEKIVLPIAHGEGNYYCDQATLDELRANHQIVFTYSGNPNGSIEDIAGITNKNGNVLGMMPHPERAVESLLGSDDGIKLFQAMVDSFEKNRGEKNGF